MFDGMESEMRRCRKEKSSEAVNDAQPPMVWFLPQLNLAASQPGDYITVTDK